MKKLIVVSLVCMTVVASWCSLFGKNISSWKDTWSDGSSTTWTQAQENSVDTATIKGKYVFEDENCNKYVKLMECLIDKTPDSAKWQTISSFEKVMSLWQWLEKTALPGTCKSTMEMLENQKDVFAKAWCELN